MKRGKPMGGDRIHVLRITDLVLYLPASTATAAIWKNAVWNKKG
jgi:hypothetical protein